MGSPGQRAALASSLASVGYQLAERFQRTDDVRDIDLSLDVFLAALDSAPPGDGEQLELLAGAAQAQLLRFEHTRQRADAERAIGMLRDALSLSQVDDRRRAALTNNLGGALYQLGERIGDRDLLDETVATFDQLSLQGPPDPTTLVNLSVALGARYRRCGDPADIERGVVAARAALSVVPVGEPAFVHRYNLATALWRRFERNDTVADLDEAITVHEAAIEELPANLVDRHDYLALLCQLLRARFERTGRLADLATAVAAGYDAVAATPANHAARPLHLSELSIALRLHADRTGMAEDLDEAIRVTRQATESTPQDDPRRPLFLGNLLTALHTRFEVLGDEDDLDRAIATAQEAVDAAPFDDPHRHRYLYGLGSVLSGRFRRTGKAGDNDKALQILRHAVDVTPAGHPELAHVLNGLGACLRARSANSEHPEADLDETVAVLRKALDNRSPDHPRWAADLSNLGLALRDRFARTHLRQDLAEARRVLQQSLDATPADDLDRARGLLNLGIALATPFGGGPTEPDLRDRALACWQEAVATVGAPLGVRMDAAVRWGALAAAGHDWASALGGYQAAVQLLPLLAWRGLRRGARQQHLRDWTGLATDTAACAISANDPEAAVELLEQGRSVLWSQILHTRTDLSELRDAEPALADRLDALGTALNRLEADLPDDNGVLATSPSVAGTNRSWQSAERGRVAREFDRLVNHIRTTLPGSTTSSLPLRATSCYARPRTGRWWWSTSVGTAVML